MLCKRIIHSATLDKNRRSKVLETISKVDMYSINHPEAMSLFDKSDEKSTIDAIVNLGVPCFFRVGKRGSYMICNDESYFAPSINLGEVVDATGCGNCSTAAALYAYCEGFKPMEVAIIANISAAYNLLQYGPYPNISSEVRYEANRIHHEQMLALEKIRQ